MLVQSKLCGLVMVMIVFSGSVFADQIFYNGFEDRALNFPRPTAVAQEAVKNGHEADATVVYESHVAVIPSTGEVWLDRTDLAVPGRAQIHFDFTRRYRSQINYEGPLGYGWDFKYNERLEVQVGGSVLRSNGKGHVALWHKNLDDSFTAPNGYFGTLVQLLDGSYLLREANGFKRHYDFSGLLQKHSDRHGNEMHFAYDLDDNLISISDVFGRQYTLEYEYIGGRDRLVILRDFTSREIKYGYDNAGHLISVTGPLITGTSTGNDFPLGRTETYGYFAANSPDLIQHNLATITYPEEVQAAGSAAVILDYGDVGFAVDRVIQVVAGGVNDSGVMAGGTSSLTYSELNTGVPLGDPSILRNQVNLVERNGTSKTFLFNERLHLMLFREHTQGLRPGEPNDYFETAFTYDEDGQLIEKLFPEGNKVIQQFDQLGDRNQQSNLLESRRVADLLRGGGEDLVTTMTYEPLFNQLLSITDPRGNATNYTPPIGVLSTDRYTTINYFDYQESNDPIPDAVQFGIDVSGMTRNLGDINQDGVINQSAGNIIRIEKPSVLLRSGSNQATQTGSVVQSVVNEIQWNDRGQELANIDHEGNATRLTYFPENDPDGDGTLISGNASNAARGYVNRVHVDSFLVSDRRTATVAAANLVTEKYYDPVGNVVVSVNPRGVQTHFEFNQANQLVAEIKGASVLDAINNGQLVTGENAFAYQTRYYYDENNRVILKERENRADVSTTNGVGDWVETEYTYDILNNRIAVIQEVDGLTETTTLFAYDANELLVRKTSPQGNQYVREYDERNLTFKEHHGFATADVAVYQYNYSLNGLQLESVDAEDNNSSGSPESTVYQYDGFDRKTTTTDAMGNQTVMTYDVASNVTRIQQMGHRANQPLAGNVLLADTVFSHDELNRVYQVDKALFLADGFNPLRAVNLFDDDMDGTVSEFTEFDALSRVTFKVEDDGHASQFIYDGVNRVIESIDALGNQQLKSYDNNNNTLLLTSIELSPEGLVNDESFTSYHVYDQLDRLVRTTDNAGRTSRFGYDSRNNKTTSSDAVGTDLGVDPWGVYPGSINDHGNTTTLYYDGRNLQLLQIRDLRVGGTGAGVIDTSNSVNIDGQITLQNVYDQDSRLVAIIDDNQQQTSYVYDALNRRINKVNADGEQHLYTYDKDSNQVTVVDPNGTVISNTFDALNRLIERNVVRGANVIGTSIEQYQYDGLSRLTQSSDNNGSLQNTHTIDRIYDSLNRLLEEQQDAEPHSLTWSGDGTRLQLQYPSSRQLDYEYDAINRMKRIIDPFPAFPVSGTAANKPAYRGNGIVVAEYNWIGAGACACYCDCSGRPLLVDYGNGTQLSYLNDSNDSNIGYNNVKEVVGLRHRMDGVDFIERGYTYNRAYMRTSENLLEVAGLPENLFEFDSGYRLQESYYDADASPESLAVTKTYALDGTGNRSIVNTLQDFNTLNGTAQFVDTYNINEVNEYTDINGLVRTHDNNGNLINANGFRYLYDYRNRMVEVRRLSDNNIKASYQYDSFNRRVSKVIFNINTEIIEEEYRYLYDEMNVIEEWGSEADYNDNGPLFTYVFGPGVDAPVQMETSVSSAAGIGRFYFHQEVRNDIAAISNDSGDVVESYRYDEFGNFSQTTGIGLPNGTGNPYLFHGRRYDPETGFMFFRNRYYDPLTGRFLQRDPVWDPTNMGNQYTFAGNNPGSYADPTGLSVDCIGISGSFVAAGGAGLGVAYCWDECGNWAIVSSVSARLGAELSLGGAYTVGDGSVKGMLGQFYDFSFGVGPVGVNFGFDSNFDLSSFSIMVATGAKAGASVGAGSIDLIHGDLSKPYPCPPPAAPVNSGFQVKLEPTRRVGVHLPVFDEEEAPPLDEVEVVEEPLGFGPDSQIEFRGPPMPGPIPQGTTMDVPYYDLSSPYYKMGFCD